MYAIRWTVLYDPDSEPVSENSGYLRSFERMDDAIEYASEYARTVGKVVGGGWAFDRYTFITEKADGYRERVEVIER